MSADPSSSPSLRASDKDRNRVIELLRAAVADGRLDPAKFDRGWTRRWRPAHRRAGPAHRRSDRGARQRRLARAAARWDVGRVGRRTAHHPRAAWLGTPRRPVDAAAPAGAAHRVVRRDAGPDQRGTQRTRAGHRAAGARRQRELAALAPGMVVDANELAVRFTTVAISRDAGDNTPETLREST